MARYAVILAIVLVVFWVSLSGFFTPLLLSLGAISIVLVVLLCARMRILDEETVPYLHIPKVFSYYFWLFAEIVKANVAVIKAVLSPEMEVSPALLKVPLIPKTGIARTLFANSITLTPGTVSVEMYGDSVLVHALLEDMSDPSGFDEMASRSQWAIGETPEDKHIGQTL